MLDEVLDGLLRLEVTCQVRDVIGDGLTALGEGVLQGFGAVSQEYLDDVHLVSEDRCLQRSMGVLVLGLQVGSLLYQGFTDGDGRHQMECSVSVDGCSVVHIGSVIQQEIYQHEVVREHRD